MYQETLAQWQQMLEKRDPRKIAELLADDVVFYSPVVYKAMHGKAITSKYLMGAFQVLVNAGHFRYINKTYSDSSAVLEFETQIDDISVNGVDIVHFDQQGLITEFKVMVRPQKGMFKLQEKMAELLEKMSA